MDRSPEPRRRTHPAADDLGADRYLGGRDLTRWTSAGGRALAQAAHRLSRTVGPHSTLLLVLTVGAALAALLAWQAGETYEAVTDGDGVAQLDHPVLRAVIGLRTPALDSLVTGYTNIAGSVVMPILAVLAMIVMALARRSWTPVLLITATGLGSLAMTVSGKNLIGRARPSQADAVPPYEHSASFPSGHTLNAVAIVGIVAYLLVLRQHRWWTRLLTVSVAGLFAVTIGLSRVFLGHHWLTDVLAAWLMGAAWLAMVITAHRLHLTVRRRRRPV